MMQLEKGPKVQRGPWVRGVPDSGTEGDQCGWSRVREDDTEARPSQALGPLWELGWFSWRETEGLKQSGCHELGFFLC